MTIEVCYLSIKWDTKGSDPSDVQKGESCDVEVISKNEYEVNTVAYPEAKLLRGTYVGINFGNERAKPYALIATGEKQQLVPVKYNQETWWALLEGWDTKSGVVQRFSELFRRIGKVNIYDEVTKQRLVINNNTCNLKDDDLKLYINSYEEELWELFIDQKSYSTLELMGSYKENISDLEEIRKFLDSVSQVLRNPIKNLVETVGKVPRRKVKPIPRTFMEEINGRKKLLSSRQHVESFNTPENQYIGFCLDNIILLLSGTSSYLESRIKRSKETIKYIKEEIGETPKDTVEVDEDAFFAQYERVFDTSDGKINSLILRINKELHEISPQITGRKKRKFSIHKKQKCIYFLNAWDGKNKEQIKQEFINYDSKYEHLRGFNVSYIRLEFENEDHGRKIDELFEHLNSNENIDIVVTGKVSLGSTVDRRRNSCILWVVVEKNAGIRICNEEIEQAFEKYLSYKADNWQRRLNENEKKQFEESRKILLDRITNLKEIETNSSYYVKERKKLYSKALSIKASLKDLKIKSSGKLNPSGSTVFLFNRDYSTALTLYRNIVFSDAVLEILSEEATKRYIGLCNVAKVYERWCLLQILKILIKDYKFKLEPGWTESLVKAIKNTGKNIKISTVKDVTRDGEPEQVQVDIYYEKELTTPRRNAAPKRPDFILDFKYKVYEFTDKSKKWEITGEEVKRLVLDAKFRGDEPEDKILETVSELYGPAGKNYSENEKNSVFVLHTSRDCVKPPTTLLPWGRSCNYGEENGHKSGHVFVTPSLSCGDTTQNLKRLIGMQLQAVSTILVPVDDKGYVSEGLFTGLLSPATNVCCIGCGSRNIRLKAFKPKKEKENELPVKIERMRWYITCNNCGLVTEKNFCFNCHSQGEHVPLFKNGLWWTYHNNVVDDLNNIICPVCHNYFGKDFNKTSKEPVRGIINVDPRRRKQYVLDYDDNDIPF